jgi:DNA polymerase-3 subunit gamma/tau
MLSQSAFNAFLKTLEEPPAHAVFVLATTEKHKIIPTILSRCQIFDFHRIRAEDAVAYLAQIASQESLEYEDDALHVIAQKADGAMRDALSIFDQVVSFSGKKITYQDVIKNLNILDYEYYFRLTFALQEGDAASALLLFNEVLNKGFDARNFINGFAAHLRDLMVCKNPETIQLMEVGAGIKEKYLKQSAEVSLPFLYSGLDICNQADIEFRSSRNQRLTIELALVKLSSLNEAQKKKPLTEIAPEKSPDVQAKDPEAGAPAKAAENQVQAKAPETPVQSNSPETRPVSASAGTTETNGSSSLIRKPGISIKDRLRGSVPEKADNQQEAEPRETQHSDLPEPEEKRADPDAIIKAWNEYASSVEKTKPRIYSTLVNHKPAVKADGKIMVLLSSEAQRDNFVKNIRSELIRSIQNATGVKSLEILTDVFAAEQNGKKIYTEQDKLDYLIKKNPELSQLKTRFNLDFDD